jgi:nucleotide-binding universal stress UspA family protein
LLGSVTEGAIHRVPCPVLAISRPQKDFIHPEEPETVRLKTILFATDFSSNSDRALYYTLKWASEWAAKVVIVHVVPETPGLTRLFPEYNPYFERQVTSAWQKIHQVLPESVEQTCEVRYEVRQGNPKDEILRVAQEKAADLIIMGAQGSGDAAALWGSVSSAVVRAGRLPVLVVRARQHLLWRC